MLECRNLRKTFSGFVATNDVSLSVEKNRSGSDLIDLELRKQLQYCTFRPDARRAEEHLISGRPRE